MAFVQTLFSLLFTIGAGGHARNGNTPEPKSGRFPLTPLPHIQDTFFSIRALPTELSPHDGESWI